MLASFITNSYSQSEILLNDQKCNYITDYYPNVYKAQIKYLKKDLDSALFYLRKIKNNCCLLNTPDILEKVMYAEISVEKGCYDEAIESLKKIVLNGFPFKYLEHNISLEKLKELPEWKKLKELSIEVNNEQNNFLNWALRKEIVSMLKLDQQVRRTPIDYSELRKVDSLNQVRIKEIFENYGYPNEKLIGFSKENENVDISFMIMHFDDLAYFKPKLLNFIKRGDCSPYVLAYLVDSNDRRNKMYTYGIYSNIDSTQIINYNNLDVRRKSIGLRSLDDHNKTMSLIRSK